MDPTANDLARVKSYYLDGVSAANRGVTGNPCMPGTLGYFCWEKWNKDGRVSYEAVYAAYYAGDTGH